MIKLKLMDYLSILNENADKSFVDRILNKGKYPVLTASGETTYEAPKDQEYHTHLMSYIQNGDKYHVFPTVLYNGESLQKYPVREAYEHAYGTNNYLEFDKEKDAADFSKNYKKIWEPKKIIKGKK